MQRYHRIPADCWRFSPEGAATAFEQAGFEVVQGARIGDSHIATGVSMGFGLGDFPEAYLARSARQLHTGPRA